MNRSFQLALALILPAWLVACGPESNPVPSDASSPLAAAARAECDLQAASDIIGEIFPPPGLSNQALRKCANILRQADRDLDDAVDKTFDFLEQTLDFYASGKLDDPSPGTTLEEAIVDLFAALFGAIGVDGPALTPGGIGGGDVVVGNVDENGGTLTVPSAHAAIQFAPGDLDDDTWVTIALIPDPDPDTAGDCPFGFPVPYDCYPLFYDYSLVPETNLAGTPVLGQCVVEPPDPDAPPSPTVEQRIRIASPDDANPGQLTFWPLATAPATVDCGDLALGPLDARDALWAGLGPLQRLFSVSEAHANPGKLGASVSTFSPFAPTDPVAGTIDATVVDAQQDPVGGATVTASDQNQQVVASDVTDSNGQTTLTVPFGSYSVSAASGPSTSQDVFVTLMPTSPSASVTLQLQPVIVVE